MIGTGIAGADAGAGRILVYVEDLRSSGVVRNAIAIARRLAARHLVTLVAGTGAGHFASAAAATGLALADLGGGPMPQRALRLRALLRRERADVLLSAGNLGHATVRLAALGLRRPLRLYRVSNAVDRVAGRASPARRALARLMLADAARVLLVGQATARSPVYARALATGRAESIPNGLDLDRARRLALAPPPHPWLERDEPVLLTVGRLHPQKDMPTLVRAAAMAARASPLRLAIVGKGTAAAEAELRAIAAAEGFADRLLLAGEQDNVFAWAAHAQAFALTSRWEGSSMALLEALAVGTPVIATRSAGDAADVLDGGRYGMLADAGDVPGIAAAILRQTGPDPVLPGRRAADYSLSRTLDRYARAVDEVLAGAVTRPVRRPARHAPVAARLG